MLASLLSDVESDRVELTRSLDNIDKFGEAICAFANDVAGNRSAGYLFVGALSDGRASGAVITDQLLQNLANIRSQGNVIPLPTMNVQKHLLGGGEMAVVEVLPSDLPPVRYKGTVWIRVGPTRRRAHEQEERLLSERRTSAAKTWDARPCDSATLDDLALDLFVLTYLPQAVSRDVVAENHRSVPEQLASLRLFDPTRQRPTNAGVVLLGKDVVFHVPGAFVQYVRYAGSTASDDVSLERQYTGDLLTVMRGLDELARELAGGRPVEVEGFSERMVYDYPPRALREIFMNAVIHRDYARTTPIRIDQFGDRLEISNPGGLYGDLTQADFPGFTAYRNPVLAEAAKTLGFVNRFGRGIPVVIAELERNGSPPAEFKSDSPGFMLVTLRRPS